MMLSGVVCATLLLLLSSSVIKVQGRPQQTKPGCRFEGKRYPEGAAVSTAQPCLQCRCVEGSLRCRLRVCPRLPQPTPPGCRVRPHGEGACCPELVCSSEEDENENILHRSNAAVLHHRRAEEGCLYEGVRYGPGSAMMGSRRCEYCYCISGERRCIRPKCLLPLPGCVPLYAPHSCCPVAYNCTRQAEFSTTLAAISGNGCRTGQRVYQEGEMVRDVTWKASCDNCFCAMGAIRCVPLACAPPLQGCKPIVREGQCCPSTYNCSGTIEVKAAQNYASYAFISKDYAKFRKETNFYPAIHDSALASSVEGRGHRVVNEALESGATATESTDSGDSSSSAPEIIAEKFAMATESMQPSLETETMNNEILDETTDYPKPTTRDQEQLTATSTEIATITDALVSDQSLITTREPIGDGSTLLAEFGTTLEDGSTTTPETSTTTVTPTTGEEVAIAAGETSSPLQPEEPTTTAAVSAITEVPVEPTSIIAEHSDNSTSRGQELESTTGGGVHLENTTTSLINPETSVSTRTSASSSLTNLSSPSSPTSTSTKTPRTTTTSMTPATTELTSQSSPVVEKVEKNQTITTTAATRIEKNDATTMSPTTRRTNDTEVETRPAVVRKPSGALSTSILVPDNMLVMNVTVKTNVAVGHLHGVTINPIGKPIPPDIEAILNITNRAKGEDYDYDYNSPTLPPSLPNVRIIPFVAADALVKDKDDDEVPAAVTGYPASAAAVPPPDLSPTDAKFYDIITQENRFSPPEKTEGGFVPQEPPYFDPLFHSSNLNLEIGTGVTVAPETLPVPNPHRKNDIVPNNCLYEEHEYGHGHILPSRALCVTCICYYGEIVCSNQKCPPLKIGCQRINNPNDKCCSKIICADGVESPTVVLDATSSSQHEPTVSPDPFRDVIKTEPAPDLPSLIGDMMLPYLVEQTSPNPGNNVYDAAAVDSSSSSFTLPPAGNSTRVGKPPAASDVKLPALKSDPHLGGQQQQRQPQHNADEIELTSVGPLDGIRITQEEEENDDESSIFSLDSMFDLFFSDPSSAAPTNDTKIAANTTTKIPVSSMTLTRRLENATVTVEPTTTTPPSSTSLAGVTPSSPTGNSSTAQSPEPTTTTTTMATTTTATLEKIQDKDPSSPVGTGGGPLKVAGCNIYGQMYGLGRIITELSSPCLECRCTDVGVQCKNLDC